MIRYLSCFLFCGLPVLAVGESVQSPDASVTADVSIVGGRLSYSLTKGSTEAVQISPLGFTMSSLDRGQGVTLGSAVAESVDESFPSRHGVHATARNHYNGKRFAVTHTATGQSYVLNVRAYDSGIAFRYEITHTGTKIITAETSSFILPGGTQVWSQGGMDVYESIYSGGEISSLANGKVMGPPVVGRLANGGGYVAITQSTAGTGFGNHFLTKVSDTTNRRLQVAFPKNGDNSYGASGAGNMFTPWNVVMVGSGLDTLVNSDIVESLAPAPDPALFPQGAATAWAPAGVSAWDWMSRFPGGITAENAKLNNYWAKQNGWIYNTIDEGWGNWNGGNPWPEVTDVCAHATPLGIKVLMWVRSADLQNQTLRTAFFTKLKAAGASGFKADFFDFNSVSPSAKERIQLVESILKEAAGYQLVADLHGTGKPLGQFRTYPNLLNFEGVYGKEQFPTAAASLYAPLTRLFAGPADYTPLGLEGGLRGNLTRAFEIATVVNMAGPLITMAERSDTVAKSPFAPVIRGIPCLWDETRLLAGSEVGEACVMARRKGDTWYVAIMNANTARNFPVVLNFLPAGMLYQAEIIRDDSMAIEYRTVTNADTLSAATTATGGFVARFRAPSTARVNSLPFMTSFNIGRGSVYAEKGTVLFTGQWADNLLADRQPDRLWQISGTGGLLTPEYDFTDPYQGGASLKFSGALGSPQDVALYRAALNVSAATKLSLAFKRGQAGVESGVQVGLTFEDAPTEPVFISSGIGTNANWNSVQLPLAAYAGRKIDQISLRFTSVSAIPSYSVKIGQLAIYDLPLPSISPPSDFRAEQVSVTGLDSFDAVLKWNASSNPVSFYRVYQKNPLTSQRVWLGVTTGTSHVISGGNAIGDETEVVFEVEAIGSAGVASSRLTTSIDLPTRPALTNPLSGTIIGTSGSFQNSGNGREKVFDGDTGTFFDSPNSNGSWAGIDLGAAGASKLIALRFYPRNGWSDRMVGGIFQGANQANFSDAVALHTVSALPRQGSYQLVEVTSTQTFRYLRYLSPDGGWGNIAEVKFFGPAKPAAPVGVKARRNATSAVIEWPPVAGAQSYKVKRSSVSGGPYEVVAENVMNTAFTDAVPDAAVRYFYVVSGVSESTGEGMDSAEVEAVDAFREWAMGRGFPAGSAFDSDADGNGVPNGMEYAIPAGLQVGVPVSSSLLLSADVRADDFLSIALFKSADLVSWLALPPMLVVEPSDAADGFRRLALTDVTNDGEGRSFYRIHVTR